MNERQIRKALGIPGDVRTWLKRRLTVGEIGQLQAKCVEEANVGKPDNCWTKSAAAFARQIEALAEGDEIWEFSSPPETWLTLRLGGRAGFCAIRGEDVLAIYITMLS